MIVRNEKINTEISQKGYSHVIGFQWYIMDQR